MVMVRRSLPFRVLCLLLIACVLCCSCLMPYAQAVVIAGAAAYGAVELIAAILIGCGIIATTSDDARDMAREVFGWLQTNAAAVLDKINMLVSQALASAIVSGVRVSGEVVDSIRQAVSDLTTSDADGNKLFTVPASDVPVPDGQPTFDQAVNEILPKQYDATSEDVANVISKGCVATVYLPVAWQDYGVFYLWKPPEYLSASEIRIYPSLNVRSQTNGSVLWNGRPFYCIFGYDDGQFLDVSAGKAIVSSPVYSPDGVLVTPNVLDAASVSIPYEGDIVSPSDDYLVRVPDLPDVQTDDEGKEVVVYPDLSLNPTDHLADIPKQETGEQVDVPYDTLVDVGTGEAVGEGEGVENPDIPTEGTDTGLIQNILDKITNFFDSPSDFKLDFDGFKNLILPDRFPFCIPFDLINSVRVFAASAANFSFDIDLETSYFSVHHTVDLSPFAVPIAFFRYTCVLFWIWVLITRTRDLMKW